ncbi:MAG: hypothetical protein VW518_03010, partial [Burkholderiaceae bacterium]
PQQLGNTSRLREGSEGRGSIAIQLQSYFFRLAGLTRLGLPAGWPRRFFSAIFLRFSAALISPAVFGVLLLTRVFGRQ